MKSIMVMAGLVLVGSVAWVEAQNAPPTTQPSTQPTADQVLSDLLRPGGSANARPLKPMPDAPAVDRTSGVAAVAPNAEPLAVMREGSFIVDKVGRMNKSAEGVGWELAFDSDGMALKDPPVVLLPSLKLMMMEDQLKQSNRDLKFRVTGQVTEYRGRNYLLLEKVVVIGN